LSEDKDKAGLGRVVYSVDQEKNEGAAAKKKAERAEREERAEVEQADTESFPASDAPSFAGGKEPPCE
jgi:hypothetical protein